MSSIAELRAKQKISEEVKEQKAKRIHDTIQSLVHTGVIDLCIANHMEEEELTKTDKVEEAVKEVTRHVIAVSDDPTGNFDDVCIARGLSKSQIREAVEFYSRVFNLEAGSEYKVKKEAVALYFQQHPHLYRDLDLVYRPRK